MDADTILRIRPALKRYLKEFDDRFGRVTTRRHLDTYAEGRLSDLRRKSIEPIARRARNCRSGYRILIVSTLP